MLQSDFFILFGLISIYVLDFADFTPDDIPVSGNRIAGEKGFQDKTVFLTGATGFIGKAYIEKVLRTCPLVKKIYVLVRTKKGKDPHTRMMDIFDGPLFNILRKERGNEILKKVVAISGDIMEIGLGISQEDRELLRSEVQIIVHSAATINFNEPIKRAVLINTRGTKFMLDFAKECKNLLIFTYISTAYCHPNEQKLYEKVYPPPADPNTVINTIEWLGDMDALNDNILGTYPNTYTFTKCLAEDLVAQEFDNLPVIILRPSIVVNTWKEPIPGWTDTMNGVTGMFVAVGKGVLRYMNCDSTRFVDCIPADIFINLLLFATFNYLNCSKLRIYNCTAFYQNKLTYQSMIDEGNKIYHTKLPYNVVLWYPRITTTKSKFIHNMNVLFYQYLPAVLLDALIFLSGKKPVMLKIQQKIQKTSEVFQYYLNNDWEFYNDESLKLRSVQTADEKIIYQLDDRGFNIEDYCYNCVHYSRLYLLNEPDSTIPSAKRHMKIMWAIDQITRLIFYIGFVYLIYTYVISPIFGF